MSADEARGPWGGYSRRIHALIHVLHAADVLVQDLHGLVEHGQEHTVDDEAGLVLGQDGALAHVLTNSGHDVNGLLRGAQAVDDLHQAHHRHGEKKCRPTTFSGRAVAAARLVMEIEEVLEAKWCGRRRSCPAAGR